MGKPTRQWTGCALMLGLLVGPIASAQTPPDSDDQLWDTADGASAPAGEARGWEEEPGVKAEDVALFLPRAILFVPKIALTGAFFLLRGALEVIERNRVIETLDDLRYFDESHTFGFMPSFSFLSSLGASFGVDVFHNNVAGNREELNVGARFGGHYDQAYEVAFAGDRVAGSRLWLEVLARFEINPDLLFAGIGIDDTALDTYYSQDRFLGLVRAGYTFGREGGLSRLGFTALVNQRDFGADEDNNPRSIEEIFDVTQITAFESGSTVFELDANMILDHRATSGLNSSGTYFESFGGMAFGGDFGYLHYGAELSYTIDLFRTTRLLTFRTALEAVHGETEDIPFTDLPRLGGSDRLRGYANDRFRDEIAALGSVEYHYAIHHNILASLFLDIGTVAGDYGELFEESDNWQLGYGGGLTLGSSDDVSLRFDIAYGDGLHLFLSSDFAFAFDDRSSQL